MTRHHEPNASHYSARYAERRRAAERARDAQGPRQRKCSRSTCAQVVTRDHLCAECRGEYERLRASGDFAAADTWVMT